jgi:serine/threonine protein kinase/TolB-like protein
LDPERWRRIERIYHEALARAPDTRAEYLQQACGDDPVLVSEVQSLIESHAQSSEFLETPVLHEAASRLAAETAMPPGACVGHYEVRELLAVGGMGEVYRAWDQVLERDVGIKILREGINGHARTPADLRREAQAAARLTHPNICTVHEVYESEGRACLVMEYVAGPTLTDLLEVAPLPLERVIRYGIEIADALAHAHDRGVLHKDLKSANVMVTESDHIKVVDFGIARRLDPASVAALTRGGADPSHTLSGTPAYMAPELLCGERAGPRSDIWALGVLLHEMTTRELPFTGHTEYELAAAILHAPPRPLPDAVPGAFRLLIERCLAKNGAERFASAAEVRQALSEVLNTITREEEPGGAAAIAEAGWRRAERPRSSALRSRRTWAALAVVLLVALGGAWWTLQHRREPASGPPSSGLPVLAVLPFRLEGVSLNLSNQDRGVIIADSIIARLSRLRLLRVLQVGSIVPYRNGEANPATIGRELGATHVLSGTARRVADQYAVDLRLVRTADGTESHETIPVPSDRLLKLEERVAEQVVRAFNLGLSDTERERLTRPITTNSAAYEEYQKGRTAVLRGGEEAVDAAVSAFRGALHHDPNFPAAQAGLAMALVRRPWYASSPEESRRRKAAALRAALQAATLDPLLAQTHEALAAVYRFSEFEWEEVIDESVRALTLSPSLELPHYNLATAFYHLGLFALSDRAAEAGLRANPRTRAEYIRNRGRSALYDGRFETAVEFLAESERTSDDGPRWMLGEAYYYVKERERSLALLERVRRSTQHIMRERAEASLAAILAADGRRDEARRRLKALARPTPDHHVSHRIGTTYAQLGEADEAVRWLRQAVDAGFPCYACFEKDPLLAPVRGHPSFQRFRAELRPTADRRRRAYTALAVPRL